MKTKRPWYPKKWQWAEAQAKEAREAALRAGFRSSYGYKPRAQAIHSSFSEHTERARRFEAMAARLKAANE